MKYAKFISETSVDLNPPRSATINGRVVTGELPADYLATLDFLPFSEEPFPSEDAPEGKHWEARYATDGATVTESWIAVENLPPAPRVFSKLKCVAALMEAGVWHEVKVYIEGAGLYDLYLAAQDFKEDNPYFVSGKAQLMTSLGWTEEQAEALLSKCIVGY